MVAERYALINNNNRVVNTIVYDPDGTWPVPAGHAVVRSDKAGIRDLWSGSGDNFTPFVPPPPSEYTDDELEALADGVTSLADAKQVLKKFARGLGRRIQKP